MSTLAKVIWYGLGVAIGLAALAALGAVLVLIAWNLGVVHAVAAAGGHVGALGFQSAFGISVLLGIIRRLFVHEDKPPVTIVNNYDKSTVNNSST